MRVALTGGFGSGKSTVAAMLEKKGARLIDSDTIVHELFAKNHGVRAEVRKKFGSGAFGADGKMDRLFLAKSIFSKPARRLTLEKIVHPAVRREILRRTRAAREKVVVIDIPLLFESGWKEKFDAVVVVTAGTPQRLKRLAGRGFTQAEARRRMRAQVPLARKARLADHVIDNNGTRQHTKKQIDRLWKRLTIHHEVVRGTNGLARK